MGKYHNHYLDRKLIRDIKRQLQLEHPELFK